jgi:hypothetical protein
MACIGIALLAVLSFKSGDGIEPPVLEFDAVGIAGAASA